MNTDKNYTQIGLVNKRFLAINFILLATLVSFLVAFIILSGYTFSQKYAFSTLKRSIDEIGSGTRSVDRSNSDLSARDLNTLLSFAIKKGMVEAKDVLPFFQNNPIAFKNK